jgi:N-acetylglucosamine kinase-like BadF-type ATPase
VIGIDGGGTRTRAALVNAEGEVCGVARAGCGNFQAIGLEGLDSLLGRVLGDLETQGQQPEGLCLALAGAGRLHEQESIAALARRRQWARRICVVSDARAALEGAHGSGAGLIAIAGTGSMVLGKNGRGQLARAGGWGPVLGDEGSGYYLGVEGLRAVLRVRDGCGAKTLLTEMLRAQLDLGDWEQIVPRVYSGQLEREAIAALAPTVFAAARLGDQVAQALVAQAGAELGIRVKAVAHRLGLEEPVELVCVGGVFKEREALWPFLAGQGVRLKERQALLPPVLGAALLAWQQLDWPVEGELVQRLSRTCPEGLD